MLHLLFIMFVSCSSTPSQSDEAKQALEKFDVKVVSLSSQSHCVFFSGTVKPY